jgi:hypothetical protein
LERNLAEAILYYGQAANDVFGYDPDAEIADLSGLSSSAVYVAKNVPCPAPVDGTNAVTGASFMALTKPEFRFYTSGIDEQAAIAYNNAGVRAEYADGTKEQLNARFVKKADNSILIEVTGVSAENMEKEIVVHVTGLGDIRFSGYAFAKTMANAGTAAQQNLGVTLFWYGYNAKMCFVGEGA